MLIQFEIPRTDDAPPGGWKYTQKDSGYTFRHFDYSAIEKQVISHRKGNNYPIPDNFQEVFRNEMCEQNPNWGIRWCRRVAGGSRLARTAVLFDKAKSFLAVLGAFKKAGGQFVSQEEADRRAEICARCPLNTQASFGCGNCVQVVADFVMGILGQRTTLYDQELNFCSICGCKLSAAVHFPIEAQEEGLTQEQKDQFNLVTYCWKKTNV